MSSDLWKIKKIGDVADIVMGQSPESKYYNYVGLGPPFLQGNRTFGYKYPTYDTYCTNGNKYADPNDVLLSVRAPVGDLNITKERICIGRGLASLGMKNGNNEYLYYLLKANISELISRESGTVYGSVNRDDISNFEVLVVDSDKKQREISDILSALDEKIELNRQTNATLEAIAQAIYKEWFVDFNFPGATGEMVESELGLIPKGWRVGRLADLGQIVCGKTPSKTNASSFGGNIPFIKIPDMHNSVFVVKTSDSLTINGAESQENKFIPKYSILVSCIATVGLVSITTENSQTNQQINSIIPSNGFSTFYIYYLLRSLRDQLVELGGGGSATMNVNTTVFSNIKILVPPEITIFHYDSNVKELFNNILVNLQDILVLVKIRDGLLPYLMGGRLIN